MSKDLYARGKKIPFENVVRNLRRGIYRKNVSDYANGGVSLFLENKFSDNLGVPLEKLYEMGLLRKQDQLLRKSKGLRFFLQMESRKFFEVQI